MEAPPPRHGPLAGRLTGPGLVRPAASLAAVGALLWLDLRPLDRGPLGLEAPLGSPAVLVVHALAALPLAAAVALRTTRLSARGAWLVACAGYAAQILWRV